MEERIYSILNSKKKTRIVILLVIVAFIASVMMIPTKLVLAKMLPGKSANTFSIYVDTATDSSLAETKRVTDCVTQFLKREKEVTDVEIYLAQGAPLDYAGLVKGSALKRFKNQAEMVVNLTDKHTRDEPSYMMVHRLRPKIQDVCEPMARHTRIRFIEMPSGPPTLATIVIELYGKNDKKRRETAEKIADILKHTDGLVDIDIMQDDIYDYYQIVPEEEKVLRSGLSVEQVNNILYLAFKGMIVAVKNSRTQQDQIPIFVRLNKEGRWIVPKSKFGLELKLSRLRLMNKMGMMIPVK